MMEWLKFSLERHACQLEEYHSMSNYCDHISAMLGPCLGHIRAMLWLFLQCLCFQITETAKNFTKESCMTNRRILLNFNLFIQCWGHVLAILGPCLDYFYSFSASRCLKWLKFSLESHASQIEQYHSMSNDWDHIRAYHIKDRQQKNNVR